MKLLDRDFIVDKGYHDVAVPSGLLLSNQDKHPIRDTRLVHRVTLGAEEEVAMRRGRETRRDGNRRLNVLLCQQRRSAWSEAYQRYVDGTRVVDVILGNLMQPKLPIASTGEETSLDQSLDEHRSGARRLVGECGSELPDRRWTASMHEVLPNVPEGTPFDRRE